MGTGFRPIFALSPTFAWKLGLMTSNPIISLPFSGWQKEELLHSPHRPELLVVLTLALSSKVCITTPSSSIMTALLYPQIPPIVCNLHLFTPFFKGGGNWFPLLAKRGVREKNISKHFLQREPPVTHKRIVRCHRPAPASSPPAYSSRDTSGATLLSFASSFRRTQWAARTPPRRCPCLLQAVAPL